MIRQDYILRLVQEMVQVLARVVFLKSRREYEQAMREINEALRALDGTDGQGTSALLPEEWIALCQKHESGASGLTIATADLLRFKGELLSEQGRLAEAHDSRVAALALFLEAILAGQTFVSVELLEKVERLVEETADGPRTTAVWLRLVHYFEARDKLALAEDALFAWLESGDVNAIAEGFSFYDRLLTKTDAELERGGLPRNEVEQGRVDLQRLADSKHQLP
jgi:hypothetical protein